MERPCLERFPKRAVNDPEFSDNGYDNYTLTLNYALGESTVTSVTGFSSYEFEELLDGDIGIATVFGIPSSEDYEQFSQELRLTSAGRNLRLYCRPFYQTSGWILLRPGADATFRSERRHSPCLRVRPVIFRPRLARSPGI